MRVRGCHAVTRREQDPRVSQQTWRTLLLRPTPPPLSDLPRGSQPTARAQMEPGRDRERDRDRREKQMET